MSFNKKIYLNCPYKDKEECKALGGKWDKDVRKWYITDDVDKSLFSKWIMEEEINDNDDNIIYLDDEVEQLKNNVIDVYDHVSNIYKIIAENEEDLIVTTSEKPAMQQYLEAIQELKEGQDYSEEEWNTYFKFDIETMAFINLPDDIKKNIINQIFLNDF